MLMQLWAIERVCDQKLLPMRPDRAHSRADFDDKGAPRLFLTRQAALCALKFWKQGVWRQSRTMFLDGVEAGVPEPVQGTERFTEARVVPVVVMKVVEGVAV